MGLSIEPGDFGMSYHGFGALRAALADHYGITLDEMDGFGGETPWSTVVETCPLVPLLDHSDCDGFLSIGDCVAMAKPLEDIALIWSFDPPADASLADSAEALADTVQAAARGQYPLQFC